MFYNQSLVQNYDHLQQSTNEKLPQQQTLKTIKYRSTSLWSCVLYWHSSCCAYCRMAKLLNMYTDICNFLSQFNIGYRQLRFFSSKDRDVQCGTHHCTVTKCKSFSCSEWKVCWTPIAWRSIPGQQVSQSTGQKTLSSAPTSTQPLEDTLNPKNYQSHFMYPQLIWISR